MLTVGKDAAGVERLLSSGRLECPGCGQRLGGWGHARPRVIRGDGGVRWRLRPRRADVQRVPAYACAVAGQRAGAAGGCGHGDRRWRWRARRPGWGTGRSLTRLGRPAATVRGWLRRFASRAGALRSAFTGLLREVDADPLMPGPAGSPLADAVAAVLAAAVAVARRWGSRRRSWCRRGSWPPR